MSALGPILTGPDIPDGAVIIVAHLDSKGAPHSRAHVNGTTTDAARNRAVRDVVRAMHRSGWTKAPGGLLR